MAERLGFGGTLAIAVGTTVGGGIFAFTVPAAREAGGLLPYAFVVGVIPALFALAPIVMLAAAAPTSGGNYVYPSRIVSQKVAFVAVWAFAFGALFGIFPLYALTAVDFIKVYAPELPEKPAAALLLAICFAVNYRGVKLAAAFEAALVVLLLVALLAFAGLGVSHVEASHLALRSPSGWTGVLSGGTLLTFAFVGSNALIELGADIERPERTIPLAMLVSLALVLLLYVGIGLVTVGVAPFTELEGNADLIGVARRFLSPPLLLFFVLGGALTAIGTSLNAFFLWGTKSLQALCADGLLPRAWAVPHPRFATPARLLTGVFLLALVGLFLPTSREAMNAFATIGGLLMLIPVQLAAMWLPRRYPELYRRSRFKLPGPLIWIAPGVGILIALAAIVTVFVELVELWALLPYGLWTLAGASWIALRDLRQDGVDLRLGGPPPE